MGSCLRFISLELSHPPPPRIKFPSQYRLVRHCALMPLPYVYDELRIIIFIRRLIYFCIGAQVAAMAAVFVSAPGIHPGPGVKAGCISAAAIRGHQGGGGDTQAPTLGSPAPPPSQTCTQRQRQWRNLSGLLNVFTCYCCCCCCVATKEQKQQQQVNAEACASWIEQYGVRPGFNWGSLPPSLRQSYSAADCDATICDHWRNKYGIVPYVSLGSLPEDLRASWEWVRPSTNKSCNGLLTGAR